MTTYPLPAYPWRPAEWHENEDRDWGPYHYPQGVPASMLTTVNTADGTPVQVRTELAPLFRALHLISEKVFGYPLHTPTGGFTGGYENRVIGSTSTPSSHSRGTTADYRAQDNPQSYTFISTWPPELVKIWTDCGFYWGGYYRGAPYDTMHMPYGLRKADVPASFDHARDILRDHGILIDDQGVEGQVSAAGGQSVPAPKPAPAPSPKPTAPGYPLKSPQVFGVWNEPGWGAKTRSGDPRFDGDAIRAEVRQIQAKVGAVTDGIYGPKTRALVVTFQRAHGLVADGMVGPNTWKVMFS